ncbi:MAG: protein kinase [Planctomycetota bacterium]
MTDTPHNGDDAELDAPGGDLSGQLFGDYQILRRLGKGGMAVVYLAQQQSLARQVAIKVLMPHLAKDEQYVRRFKNEARAAAALVHANIVQIHEVGQRDGLQFIAQEYVAGENLKQLLDRNVTLDSAQTVAILRQVASALAMAERHGIVHRDIKPENILINTDGVVKVADFGLARQNSNQDGMELTQVGVTMGTPLYMSPEQVEGKSLDTRSDIYSLGVTAYQVLAGHPPFQGDTPLSLAVAHVKEPPPPLADECPKVSEALAELIHQMLAKQPDDRFESAQALSIALDALPSAGGRQMDTALSGSVVEYDPNGETAASSFAETRELSTLLRSGGQSVRRRRIWRDVLVTLAAAIVGGMLAWSLGQKGVLAQAAAPTVPKKESIERQYLHAAFAKTEESWKAVEEYFPVGPQSTESDRLQILRSKQQLARWYIANDRPAEAIPILEELTNLDDMYTTFRADGYAHQVIAYWNMGEKEKVLDVLQETLLTSEYLSSTTWEKLDSIQRELLEKVD